MDDAAADHEVSVRDDPDDAHTEAAVDELTDILGQLDSKPDDVPLLRQQIRLLQQLHMVDEALDTIRKMASLVMLSEGEGDVATALLNDRSLAVVLRQSYPNLVVSIPES